MDHNSSGCKLSRPTRSSTSRKEPCDVVKKINRYTFLNNSGKIWQALKMHLTCYSVLSKYMFVILRSTWMTKEFMYTNNEAQRDKCQISSLCIATWVQEVTVSSSGEWGYKDSPRILKDGELRLWSHRWSQGQLDFLISFERAEEDGGSLVVVEVVVVIVVGDNQ